MEKYDIRKEEKQWKFVKEGSSRALKAFETKKEAVEYGRDYLRKHGGDLRIWKGDGISLQEERSYVREAETVERQERSFYDGILEGVGDAAKAAGHIFPVAGKFISKGVYEAGYYAAYGVVFGATMVARLLPLPSPLAHGVQDGAQAALGSAEEPHHPDKTAPAAS